MALFFSSAKKSYDVVKGGSLYDNWSFINNGWNINIVQPDK